MFMVGDTWRSRDEPVLRVAAHLLEMAQPPGSSVADRAIAEESGLPLDDVVRGLLALNSGRYLAIQSWSALSGTPSVVVEELTERGRRLVGLWPAETIAADMVEALERAADATSDDEQRGRIRSAARAFAGMSRDVAVDVLAAIVTKHSGIA